MQTLIKQFIKIIKISSETGNEQEMSDYCLRYFKNLNLEAKQDKANNIFVKINCNSKNNLLLNAHLDTVIPGKNINPIIKNDKITSDGKTILGADNKIFVALLMRLAKDIVEQKISPKNNLEILLTTSEEIDNIGAKQFDYSLIKSKYVLLADSCGNPVGSITVASPFYLRFDGVIKGVAKHASVPEEAINVLPAFNYFFEKLNCGKTKDRTLNTGKIQAGDVRNTIPGELEFLGELRCFNNEILTKEKKRINNLMKETKNKFKLNDFNIKFHLENKGYEIKNDPVVDQIKKEVLKLEMNCPIIKSWTCSDANIFIEKGLIPINIGEGVYGAHTTQEHIFIKEYKKLYQLFRNIVC